MDFKSRQLSSANFLQGPYDPHPSYGQVQIHEQLMRYERLPPPRPHQLVHRAELLAFRARYSSGSLSPLRPSVLENCSFSDIDSLDETESRCASRHHEIKLAENGNNNQNCIQWERAPSSRYFVDKHRNKVHHPNEVDRIGELERLLKVVEERCQRECFAKTLAEERVGQLEQELRQLERALQFADTDNSETRATEVREEVTELQPPVGTAHETTEHSRITELEGEVEELHAQLSRANKAGTDPRTRRLEQEVNSLQGQLALQKLAVQVEQSQLNKLTEENGKLREHLDKLMSALKSERLKIKVLADREAERSNKDPQERMRIAHEKLKVMSEALGEERDKNRKLKATVTRIQAQLNTARKEANGRHFMLELKLRWLERIRAAEQRGCKKVKDELSLAHAIIDSRRGKFGACRANSA